MRPLAAVALSMGGAAAAEAADRLAGPIPATVVRVVDGDTLEVRAHIWVGQEVAVGVRVAGVNTPETYRPQCEHERELGEAASAFVEALALTEVTLTEVEHDKYGGRVAARVALPDGRDLGELLLAQGHAVAYPEPGRGDWCAAAALAPAADRG